MNNSFPGWNFESDARVTNQKKPLRCVTSISIKAGYCSSPNNLCFNYNSIWKILQAKPRACGAPMAKWTGRFAQPNTKEAQCEFY